MPRKRTDKEIHDFVMEGIRGANLIDEMRRDGRLPPDYNRSPSDLLQKIQEAMAEDARKREVNSNLGATQSTNHILDDAGRDPSALGFQVRAAMFNAGNKDGRPFRPEMINGAMSNYIMDLRDQAGTPYNIAAPWEEL